MKGKNITVYQFKTNFTKIKYLIIFDLAGLKLKLTAVNIVMVWYFTKLNAPIVVT